MLRSGLYWSLPHDRIKAAIREARASGLIGPHKPEPKLAPIRDDVGGAGPGAAAKASEGALIPQAWRGLTRANTLPKL